jgi:hypothetical protein
MANEKSCFIIMPITVPEAWLDKYRDGKEHFNHVLDCLFVPSVKRAGFKPIPPKATGSDLIHAGIIENLETSDIVLCDMSCLNPNVFFEFGIRTSLNKPVCVVRDELTPKVPFDTGILNHQEYQSSLETWLIEAEIEKLSKHLTASVERSKGQNTLWKYFGLKTEASAYEVEAGAESKLDYLTLQMDSVREQLEALSSELEHEAGESDVDRRWRQAMDFVSSRLPPGTRLDRMYAEGPGLLSVVYSGELDRLDRDLLAREVSARFRIRIHWLHKSKGSERTESGDQLS